MQSTSAETLEYEALRTLLGRYISSPLGPRGTCPELNQLPTAPCLEETLAEASEADQLFQERGTAPDQCARARHGAADPSGFRRLAGAFHHHSEAAHRRRRPGCSGIVRRDFAAGTSGGCEVHSCIRWRTGIPRLGARGCGDWRVSRRLLRAIQGKILPDGSVADNASVALNRLRRDIEKQKKQINDSLERFLRAHRDDGILQEEIITIRNDRFVVPVVSGQRRKVDGVIHAASSTGHTLFVEPMDTIDLNNELVRLTEEEFREVQRILKELTENLRAHAPAIRQTLEAMSALEFVFAKAQVRGGFQLRDSAVRAEPGGARSAASAAAGRAAQEE